MLRIRLRRVGKKGKPSYRIVVAEVTAPRDGAYLEWIGNYDPMADPPAIILKEDRAVEWLSKGAQPSDAVARILEKSGIFQRTEQFRKVISELADEVAPVDPLAPTEVSVVEVSSPPEATVDEPPTEEPPQESTAPAASVEEAPEPAGAPEAEEPDEAPVEETSESAEASKE